MIQAVLPQPMLTLALAAIWVFLMNTISLGTVLMGLVVGVVVPLFTHRFWPSPPRLKSPRTILAYLVVVLKDIVLANIDVARIVLFKRNQDIRPAFMAVPLTGTTPEAITVLAGTITMTPGTVSADLSADGRVLLVHGLDVADPPATVADIQERYEKRLLEIFA